MYFAVSAGLPGCFSKALDVVIEAGQPLAIIIWIAREYLPAGNDATIHFIQPDLVPILGRFVCLIAPDDVRVGFEDADDLLGSRHFFLLEHTPNGLGNYLLCSGNEGVQGLSQFLGLVCRLLLQDRQYLLRLFERGFGRPDEFPIGSFPFGSGLLTSASHAFPDLAGQTTGAADAVAKDLLAQLGLLAQNLFCPAERTPQHADSVRQ